MILSGASLRLMRHPHMQNFAAGDGEIFPLETFREFLITSKV